MTGMCELTIYGAAGLGFGLLGGLLARRIVTARGRLVWSRRWLSVLPVATAVATSLLWVLIATSSSSSTPVRPFDAGLGAATILVLSAAADVWGRIIPNEIMAAAAVVGLGLLLGDISWMSHILTAAGSVAGGVAIREGSRQTSGRSGIGMGDVKLVAVLGVWMGPSALWATYLGIVCAAMGGGVLLVLGITDRRQPLPLAPFLLVGFLVQWFALDAGSALELIPV